MPVMRQDQRMSARMPIHVYEVLGQAAELTGATLNQFVVQSALEKAEEVIERERFIRISGRSAAAFFEAVENPPEPTQRLKKAISAYKESFDGAQD